ncbi:heme o synthase [Aquibacillus koreensis]|uniref:Protoheme IX farnesyltransferase n=1 Tax=Aquibacillus koreensis TaxID=279446 RepID=A0A9X3WM99_9BACI|nr:heme o synthase [Aquibacillus koreensis]MCT2537899.1 heme o synthase [Aquibacillus koreensis]MDC3422667.1 heme o synthase [Aquibacillus koreensis]
MIDQTASRAVSQTSVIADIKSLFKGLVLISNVLPVLIGFWLALYFSGGSFGDHWLTFVLTIIGSITLIGGALVLNNWYDVDIDTVMKRTQHRPTVTGTISLRSVLILGIGLSVIGFNLMLFTNVEVAVYGLIGWFTYVVLYTMWSKRKYTWNTLIGSVSGAVTPLIGWAAVSSTFHIVPIVLFVVMFLWQMPHTYAIAMKKCEEYAAAKVAMLPVVRGFQLTKRQSVVYIACLLPLPFFLATLGTVFVVVATVLNIVWLGIGISGFFVKNELRWAHVMFLSSLHYLMVFFFLIMFVTMF